jgi:hypothetical protein
LPADAAAAGQVRKELDRAIAEIGRQMDKQAAKITEVQWATRRRRMRCTCPSVPRAGCMPQLDSDFEEAMKKTWEGGDESFETLKARVQTADTVRKAALGLEIEFLRDAQKFLIDESPTIGVSGHSAAPQPTVVPPSCSALLCVDCVARARACVCARGAGGGGYGEGSRLNASGLCPLARQGHRWR